MKHVLHSCNADRCFICDGGLGACEVCGGAEADLPTDCPGRKMNTSERDAVANGWYDFQDGKWIGKLTLDLSNIPIGADWIIGITNGGLTVHAQVGHSVQEFGGTPQAALDAAVASYLADEELLV